MEDISRTDIERFIRLANKLRKKRSTKRTLPNFILGLLFFQESTRTQIGFQTAAYRLGGEVFALKETKFTKYMSSAETIEDTLRVLQSYADIICIRDSNSNVFSAYFLITISLVLSNTNLTINLLKNIPFLNDIILL